MIRTYIPLVSIEATTETNDYIKNLILVGNKILPPIVDQNGKIQDGRKRVHAYREIGQVKNIEVFIGTGSQDKIPILEGAEDEPSGGIVLAESPYLRLELRENYHLHYGEGGKYRVIMGKRDFEELSKAILWAE